MSFILDALKKSESDRQRQSGPALFEVKVTAPKLRFPYWALALAVLLVINIVIGAWVFLRRPAPAQAPPAAAPTMAAAPSAAAPAVAETPASHAAPLVAAATPPVATPPPAAPIAAAAAVHPEPVLSNTDSKDAPLNPDDYEPAVAAAKQDQDLRGGHVRSGTQSGLVSYADAAANPDLHLPAVRIDLHVYAASPQERFVLINMHRLHEGESLPEGVRVESITPEGAIVSYRGSKFFLDQQ
jgi:general secretion pathway protein B